MEVISPNARLAERWSVISASIERWRSEVSGPSSSRSGECCDQLSNVASYEDQCLRASTTKALSGFGWFGRRRPGPPCGMLTFAVSCAIYINCSRLIGRFGYSEP